MAHDQNLSFEERATLRQRLAYPILRTFEKWLGENLSQVLLTDILSRVDETGINIEDLLPHKWKKKVNM